MHVTFETKKLRQLCESQLSAEKHFGIVIAASLRGRMADLLAAETIGDLPPGLLITRGDTTIEKIHIPLAGTTYCITLRCNNIAQGAQQQTTLTIASVEHVRVIAIERFYDTN